MAARVSKLFCPPRTWLFHRRECERNLNALQIFHFRYTGNLYMNVCNNLNAMDLNYCQILFPARCKLFLPLSRMVGVCRLCVCTSIMIECGRKSYMTANGSGRQTDVSWCDTTRHVTVDQLLEHVLKKTFVFVHKAWRPSHKKLEASQLHLPHKWQHHKPSRTCMSYVYACVHGH